MASLWERSANLYISDTRNMITNTDRYVTICFISIILFSMALYLFVIQPSLGLVFQDVDRMKKMLLLIPLSIVNEVDVIRDFLVLYDKFYSPHLPLFVFFFIQNSYFCFLFENICCYCDCRGQNSYTSGTSNGSASDRARSYLAATLDAVSELDREFRILACNNQFYSLFKISESDSVQDQVLAAFLANDGMWKMRRYVYACNSCFSIHQMILTPISVISSYFKCTQTMIFFENVKKS